MQYLMFSIVRTLPTPYSGIWYSFDLDRIKLNTLVEVIKENPSFVSKYGDLDIRIFEKLDFARDSLFFSSDFEFYVDSGAINRFDFEGNDPNHRCKYVDICAFLKKQSNKIEAFHNVMELDSLNISNELLGNDPIVEWETSDEIEKAIVEEQVRNSMLIDATRYSYVVRRADLSQYVIASTEPWIKELHRMVSDHEP